MSVMHPAPRNAARESRSQCSVRLLATDGPREMNWDYLILTASNDHQAAAYRDQLDVRRKLGLLQGFRSVPVVPDPEGRRIGRGGSTVCCLTEVWRRELEGGRLLPRHGRPRRARAGRIAPGRRDVCGVPR